MKEHEVEAVAGNYPPAILEAVEAADALRREREIDAAMKESTLKVTLHVLSFFGDPLGPDGGGFVNRLLQLVSIADAENRRKIAVEFPEYVAAFLAAHEDIEPFRAYAKAAL